MNRVHNPDNQPTSVQVKNFATDRNEDGILSCTVGRGLFQKNKKGHVTGDGRVFATKWRTRYSLKKFKVIFDNRRHSALNKNTYQEPPDMCCVVP